METQAEPVLNVKDNENDISHQSTGDTSDSNPSTLTVGARVLVGNDNNRSGIVAYIGETQFAAGEWIGVILSTPEGKNDGTVNGVRYFQCEPLHGIFSRRNNIKLSNFFNTDSITCPSNLVEGDNAVSSLTTRDIDNPEPKDTAVTVATPALCTANQKPAYRVGDRVQVSGSRIGIIRFLGSTEFAAGEWAGIELSEPLGKNDGSVGGKRYFACKPNYGLFASVSKLYPVGADVPSRRGKAGLRDTSGQTRRSQESLLSYSSNLSSVSRSYRAHLGHGGTQGTPVARNTTTSGRPASVMNSSMHGDRQTVGSSIQVLQKVVKEKEAHIEQLLQERELERSELAKATIEREMTEAENNNQRTLIYQLNQQLAEMEAAIQRLRDENEQTTLKLHEERKTVEDLQFRMEEENIDKTSFEAHTADDEGRLFELEEALMAARDVNERAETELAQLRLQLAAASRAVTSTSPQALATEISKDEMINALQNERNQALTELKAAQARTEQLVAELQMVQSGSKATNDAQKLDASSCSKEDAIAKAEYEKRITSFEAQLFDTTKQLLKARDQCQELEKQLDESKRKGEQQLRELVVRLSEQEAQAKQAESTWNNRLAELTNAVESQKSASSIASAEQLVTIKKLEEKLKAAEKQLADYQMKFCESALDHLKLENEKNEEWRIPGPEGDTLTQTITETEMLFKTQLEEQRLELESVRQQLMSVGTQRDSAQCTAEQSQVELGRLAEDLDTLRTQLTLAIETRKGLEQQLEEATTKRDQLMMGITSVLREPHVDQGETANSSDLNASEQSDKLTTLMTKLAQQVSETEHELGSLKQRVQQLEVENHQLEQQLGTARQTLRDLEESAPVSQTTPQERESIQARIAAAESDALCAMQQLENKSLELGSVQKQLFLVSQEYEELQQAHKVALQGLEEENRLLKERIGQAEMRLHELENKAHHPLLAADIEPVPSGEELDVTRLLEGKESAERQIDFLNSIILDQHKKNTELENRVRELLADFEEVPNAPLRNNTHPLQMRRKPLPPPRLWCDHCLIFDSHETEDCHVNSPVLTKKPISSKPAMRVYCEICGVFDSHSTEACTDSQTF